MTSNGTRADGPFEQAIVNETWLYVAIFLILFFVVRHYCLKQCEENDGDEGDIESKRTQ